jgi:hypothetical protein
LEAKDIHLRVDFAQAAIAQLVISNAQDEMVATDWVKFPLRNFKCH